MDGGTRVGGYPICRVSGYGEQGEVRLKDLAAGEVGLRWRDGRGTGHHGLDMLYLLCGELRLQPIITVSKAEDKLTPPRLWRN